MTWPAALVVLAGFALAGYVVHRVTRRPDDRDMLRTVAEWVKR